MQSKRFDVAVRLSERPWAHKGRLKDSPEALEEVRHVLRLMNGVDLLTLPQRPGMHRSASKALPAPPQENPTCRRTRRTRRTRHRRSALTADVREAHRRPSVTRLTLDEKMGCLHSVHARRRAPGHRGLPHRPGGPERRVPEVTLGRSLHGWSRSRSPPRTPTTRFSISIAASRLTPAANSRSAHLRPRS
jgi:hypothetical protein